MSGCVFQYPKRPGVAINQMAHFSRYSITGEHQITWLRLLKRRRPIKGDIIVSWTHSLKPEENKSMDESGACFLSRVYAFCEWSDQFARRVRPRDYASTKLPTNGEQFLETEKQSPWTVLSEFCDLDCGWSTDPSWIFRPFESIFCPPPDAHRVGIIPSRCESADRVLSDRVLAFCRLSRWLLQSPPQSTTLRRIRFVNLCEFYVNFRCLIAKFSVEIGVTWENGTGRPLTDVHV